MKQEGLTNGNWILLDYGNTVAYIFQKKPETIIILKSYGEILKLTR